MTEEEVRRDHRLAADKPAQVKILADLCCTTRAVIRHVLAGESWDEAQSRAQREPQEKKERKSRLEARQRRWSEDEAAVLERELRSGKGFKEVAAMLGRSEQSVRSAAYERRIKLRRGSS